MSEDNTSTHSMFGRKKQEKKLTLGYTKEERDKLNSNLEKHNMVEEPDKKWYDPRRAFDAARNLSSRLRRSDNHDKPSGADNQPHSPKPEDSTPKSEPISEQVQDNNESLSLQPKIETPTNSTNTPEQQLTPEQARQQYLSNLIDIFNKAKTLGDNQPFVLFATGATLAHVGEDYKKHDLPFSPQSKKGKIETDIDIFTSEQGIESMIRLLADEGYKQVDANIPGQNPDLDQPLTYRVTRDVLSLTSDSDKKHLRLEIVMPDGQAVDMWDCDSQFTDTTPPGEKPDMNIPLQPNIATTTVEVTNPDGTQKGANIQYLKPDANVDFYRIVEKKSQRSEDLKIGKAKMRQETLKTIQEATAIKADSNRDRN